MEHDLLITTAANVENICKKLDRFDEKVTTRIDKLDDKIQAHIDKSDTEMDRKLDTNTFWKVIMILVIVLIATGGVVVKNKTCISEQGVELKYLQEIDK